MFTKRDLLADRRFQEMADDEEIFPLYGRDNRAPPAIRDWAMARRSDISLGKRPVEDQAQVEAAFELADRMDAWRQENDGKWRDGLFAGVDPRA